MMTVADLAIRYGVNLAGLTIDERLVTADMCVWWASFEGWFDCRCDERATSTPGASDFTWTRLGLVLSGDDGSVMYADFSGKAPEGPPAPTITLPPTAVPTPGRAWRR